MKGLTSQSSAIAEGDDPHKAAMSESDTPPKKLKRFANLDIDGVDGKPRVRNKKAPKKQAQAAPAPAPATPSFPEPLPPTFARGPAPRAPRGPVRGGPPVMRIDLRGTPEEIPEGTEPGVVTVEVDLRRSRGGETRPTPPRRTPGPMPMPRVEPPPPSRPAGYSHPRNSDQTPAPITISPLAAREIRLMAHQAGVLGQGLRIMTSGPGGPENCEFAFEPEPTPDDEVFVTQDVLVYVDRETLASLRGCRITCEHLRG